jgi:hypothetical protein
MALRTRPVPTTPLRRGAATLIVVMVLFFLVTLVAAYTSRNLLFEQRTSTNQYRSTLALETAEAGIEWALTMLNAARINDNCVPLIDPDAAGAHFRDRYLTVNPTTFVIEPPADRIAGCIFNGTDWTCHCPTAGNPAPAVVYAGTGPYPAFWVRFQAVTTNPRPWVVRVQVNACTRAANECLSFTREAQSGDGLASVWAMVALRSALTAPPAAPLTVHGDYSCGGGELTLTNTDTASGGFTIHSKGDPTGSACLAKLNTLPGTPAQFSIAKGDATLDLPNLSLTPAANPANSGNNRKFGTYFGMWPTTYVAQPAITRIECAGGCDADAAVLNAIKLRPNQVIYAAGGGTLRIDADLGTAAAPVMIVADGSVRFNGGSRTVHGVIYSRAATVSFEGDGTLNGALIAERNFHSENNDQTLVYHRGVIDRVRYTIGSFVKVPGGWRDYPPTL